MAQNIDKSTDLAPEIAVIKSTLNLPIPLTLAVLPSISL